MWMHVMLSALTLICMSSCAVGPDRTTLKVTPSATQADTCRPGQDEKRPSVGIALAGGGTKAASYAMGVLAAVADTPEGFARIGKISSVSGGGYSAFYYYSKLLVRENDPEKNKRSVKGYFNDCIPNIYANILSDPKGEYTGHPPICQKEGDERYLFQQFVRCRQDVLEQDCNQQLEKDDGAENFAVRQNFVTLTIASLVMTAPNFISRSIFDWPVNLSPTRSVYMQGIGTAYGLYPRDPAAIAKQANIAASCHENSFLNCDNSYDSARFRREGMDFSHLKDLIQKDCSVPVWYINATNSPDRSIAGWAQKGKRDFSKYTLQMSPFEAHSGLYGPIPDYASQMDLLDAVTTSAAFLDANETVYDQPVRLMAGVGAHVFALDWGIDIPNPNVPQFDRVIHAVSPVPFYWNDSQSRKEEGATENQKSVYIRLMDGGNNDNLAAYTLIEADVKKIIISDHGQDRKRTDNNEDLAIMQDVCYLHNEIALRTKEGKPPRRLLIPGLADLTKHCQAFIDESECIDELHKSKPCTVSGVEGPPLPKGGYPILKWKSPVLLGCITSLEDNSGICDSPNDVRVYLLKPALDVESFKKDYLEEYLEGDKKKFRVKKETCTLDKPGVCEVAAFMAYQYNNHDGKEDMGHFPQDSTVAMTLASNGKKYGAYRELARWHRHEALKIVSSDEKFTELLKEQSEKENQISRIQF